MPESPVCEHLVVTVHGDGFLCEREPQFDGSAVQILGYHVTEQGWWGSQPKRITLAATVVRYVEWVKMRPFTNIGSKPGLGHRIVPAGQGV